MLPPRLTLCDSAASLAWAACSALLLITAYGNAPRTYCRRPNMQMASCSTAALRPYLAVPLPSSNIPGPSFTRPMGQSIGLRHAVLWPHLYTPAPPLLRNTTHAASNLCT